MVKKILFFTLIFFWEAPTLLAQNLLPKGIGYYQIGYRTYMPQKTTFDNKGNHVSLGTKNERKLDGETMASGDLGSELYDLSRVLREFGGNSPDSPANMISLGSVKANVEVNLQTTYLGSAYGITKKLTLFGGIPYVSASSQASLYMSGVNNAEDIRQKIGGAAFKELEDGLRRAAATNIATIYQSLADAGYAPVDRWEKNGFGDLRLGMRYGDAKYLGKQKFFWTAVTTLELPTGDIEDPDILTDISLGRGYAFISQSIEPKMVFRKHFVLGLDGSYGKAMPTVTTRRVNTFVMTPAGTSTLKSTKKNVIWTPGDETEVGASVGLTSRMFELTYRIADSRHFTDRFQMKSSSANLGPDGLRKLSQDSDTQLLSNSLVFSTNTIDAYRRKKFFIPVIVNLKGSMALAGKNSADMKYIEISFASFFDP